MISRIDVGAVDRLLRTSRDDGLRSPGISDVAWHSSNDYVGIASDEGGSVWDVETGMRRLSLRSGSMAPQTLCVNFNPQGNLVITGALDGVARLWDVRSGHCVLSLEAHSRRICAAAFNFDGNKFVTSSFDGLCRVWDTLNGQCCTTIVSPSMGSRGVPAVSGARFSPNGAFVLLSTLDSAVRLWDIDVGKCVKTYRGHSNKAYCAFSTFCGGGSSGSRPCVVSGSEDGKVYVWDLQDRKLCQCIQGHHDMVLAVDAHPTLPIIASGACGKDPTVRVWRPYEPPDDSVLDI